MIPLVHDFDGATVLVFGGGTVGSRRARRFAAEADVVVLSPTFEAEGYGDATLVRAAPGPDDVAAWVDRADPALVVAATDDPETNAAVVRAARQAGALANRVDVADATDPGTVVVPATVSDDPVTVAITTEGTSPVLARELRRRVEDELSGAGPMADLTADLRSSLRERGFSEVERRDALRAVVASDDVWKALRTGTANPRNEAELVIDELGGTP